jgi:hypothetical protein
MELQEGTGSVSPADAGILREDSVFLRGGVRLPPDLADYTVRPPSQDTTPVSSKWGGLRSVRRSTYFQHKTSVRSPFYKTQ